MFTKYHLRTKYGLEDTPTFPPMATEDTPTHSLFIESKSQKDAALSFLHILQISFSFILQDDVSL